MHQLQSDALARCGTMVTLATVFFVSPALMAQETAAEPPPADETPAATPDREESAANKPGEQSLEDLATLPFHFDPFGYETGYSPGEAETSPTVEMDEIDSPHTALFNIPFLDAPFDAASKGLEDFERETALRVRFAYTMIFQAADVGKSGGAGDFDIMSAWTLLGRGTENTGRLITTGEYRHKIGAISANALRDEIGTLQRTTGGFNDRGWVLRDLHWLQRLYEGRLRLLIGRSDVSDYVGAHRLQSINNSFSNRQFSANSTTAFPAGHTSSAGFSVRPVDEFYVTGGAANGYGQSNTNDWSTLDEGDLFYFGEVGFTPTLNDLGPGRYAVFVWHMDERSLNNLPSDTGFSVIAEQNITDEVHLFGRYGWSDDGTTGIKVAAEAGLGWRGLLGSVDNLTGAAFGISEPTDSALRDEKVLEVFHRFQLTRYTQWSVGIQGIFDPSNAPDEDAIAVFTTRFRVEF